MTNLPKPGMISTRTPFLEIAAIMGVGLAFFYLLGSVLGVW